MGVPSLRPEAFNFIKKETLAQVFSCEFCEIFKKTHFEEHLRTAASLSSEHSSKHMQWHLQCSSFLMK